MFDATSAAGGLPVNAEDFDVYYFAPQKCFASDGGLWFALMSPRALERAAAIKATGRWMPAFLTSTSRSRTRAGTDVQHPGLGHHCAHGRAGRLVQRQRRARLTTARTARSSRILYEWAERDCLHPAIRPTRRYGRRSSGTVDFADEVDAAAVAKVLRANGDPGRRAVSQVGSATSCGWPCSRPSTRRRRRPHLEHRLVVEQTR